MYLFFKMLKIVNYYISYYSIFVKYLINEYGVGK